MRDVVRRVRTNIHGYMGVEWDSSRKLFRSIIEHKGTRYKLGRFSKAEDAAIAYDTKARELRGKKARLNFPKNGEMGVVPTQKPIGRCPDGHPYDLFGNKSKNGDIVCRVCNREAQRRYKDRLRAAEIEKLRAEGQFNG